MDRGQVRHWALDHGLCPAIPKPRPLAHVRRWQRQSVGELWQLDATPDRFLGGTGTPVLQLLDMLDDCSRLQVGCRLYPRECIASYLDFFRRAFETYGLPLEIYVDRGGFFVTDSGQPTQLARRLKFYDISFVTANSPEAKGKVERIHLVWQDRLPAYFAGEGIGPEADFETLTAWSSAATPTKSTARSPPLRATPGPAPWRKGAASCVPFPATAGGSWSGRSGAGPWRAPADAWPWATGSFQRSA
ncbi:MAG: transposase family protein [Kiritimatiellae bacterium]|nr:transposase family protein [Kiritimatiellia bacterium]